LGVRLLKYDSGYTLITSRSNNPDPFYSTLPLIPVTFSDSLVIDFKVTLSYDTEWAYRAAAELLVPVACGAGKIEGIAMGVTDVNQKFWSCGGTVKRLNR